MRNISEKVLDKIKSQVLCVYEVISKNIVQPDRQQKTVWRMHIACPIRKATNTSWEYVILIVFHCNNGCKNASHCLFIIHCLFCQILIWALTMRFVIQKTQFFSVSVVSANMRV